MPARLGLKSARTTAQLKEHWSKNGSKIVPPPAPPPINITNDVTDYLQKNSKVRKLLVSAMVHAAAGKPLRRKQKTASITVAVETGAAGPGTEYEFIEIVPNVAILSMIWNRIDGPIPTRKEKAGESSQKALQDEIHLAFNSDERSSKHG